MNESTNEYDYKGVALNGILMLVVLLLLMTASIAAAIYSGVIENEVLIAPCIILFIATLICFCGIVKLEPNEVAAMCSLANIAEPCAQTATFG